MPQEGKKNEKFGVYRSHCCGTEIVITKGAIFPKCPDHPQYTTRWTLLPHEDMTQVSGKKKSESKPAA